MSDRQKDCMYLAGGHVGDGAVGLHRLQLVQTPVQLLQRLRRQTDKALVCSAQTENTVSLRQQLNTMNLRSSIL